MLKNNSFYDEIKVKNSNLLYERLLNAYINLNQNKKIQKLNEVKLIPDWLIKKLDDIGDVIEKKGKLYAFKSVPAAVTKTKVIQKLIKLVSQQGVLITPELEEKLKEIVERRAREMSEKRQAWRRQNDWLRANKPDDYIRQELETNDETLREFSKEVSDDVALLSTKKQISALGTVERYNIVKDLKNIVSGNPNISDEELKRQIRSKYPNVEEESLLNLLKTHRSEERIRIINIAKKLEKKEIAASLAEVNEENVKKELSDKEKVLHLLKRLGIYGGGSSFAVWITSGVWGPPVFDKLECKKIANQPNAGATKKAICKYLSSDMADLAQEVGTIPSLGGTAPAPVAPAAPAPAAPAPVAPAAPAPAAPSTPATKFKIKR
jgi:hypothetical protein